MTPRAAIAPRGLLAGYFAGDSWDRWRAVLGAAFSEKLDAHQAVLFREVAERDPPTAPVRELWALVGRRGGKDSAASLVATVAATGDYRSQLRPGERATVLCIASTRDQAKIIHRYIAGYFSAVPKLQPLVTRETEDTIELSNDVEIVVRTNSFRAVRGLAIVCAILDECAFYRDEYSSSPDTELYAAILPAMATFKTPMLIGISSPYRRAGLLFAKWKQSYGQPDPDVLVVRGTSLQFNPTLNAATIEREMARDPDRAASEYLAAWRSDLSDFLDRELVESAVPPGVIVRPPSGAREYRAFVDASGGRGDSFTAAIASYEASGSVLHCLYERRAPFNPSDVVAEVAELLRSYGCSTACGDKYGASWVSEAFAAQGIRYVESERDRSQIYLDALPLFTAGTVSLLDNVRLVHQFVSLERRTSKFGRDRVDHPSNGADDLANAAAGALVMVAADRRPSLVKSDDLLVHGQPAPMVVKCNGVFATMASDARGMAATIYCALGSQIAPLVILDFQVEPLSPAAFQRAASRTLELAQLHGARKGAVGLWATDELGKFARPLNLNLQPLPADFLDLGGLTLKAAFYVSRGSVKLSGDVIEKSRHSPLGGAFDFRAGIDLADDPLRAAAIYAVLLAFDDSVAQAA